MGVVSKERIQVKRSLLAVLGFGCMIAIVELNAQNQQSVTLAEPQYLNSFYSVDSSGKLINVELETVKTFHSKVRALPGYASVKMSAEFKPGHSSVRLAATSQFVVRGRAPIDPLSRFELRELKGSKDHREFLMTQAHGTIFGGSATSN